MCVTGKFITSPGRAPFNQEGNFVRTHLSIKKATLYVAPFNQEGNIVPVPLLIKKATSAQALFNLSSKFKH
jgi:hypothetical protein